MERNADCYFMLLAINASKRSTCLRRHVGAVIVKDGRILSTGYNGPPSGVAHCEVRGCVRAAFGVRSGEQHELCVGLHAEQNAIINAARFGISVRGSTIYVTTFPCSLCARMIVNSGIKAVVYCEEYSDKFSGKIMRAAGIVVRKLAL